MYDVFYPGRDEREISISVFYRYHYSHNLHAKGALLGSQPEREASPHIHRVLLDELALGHHVE